MLELIKNIISSLLINKGRLIFGVLSISIGIATLIGAMSISETQRMFLKREMEKIGSNLIIVCNEAYSTYEFTEKDIDMIKRCPGVLKVDHWVWAKYYQIQYFNKSLRKVWIIGRTSEIKEMANLSLKYGRFFTKQEEKSCSNVGVIGKDLAFNLFGKRNPTGKNVFIIVDGNKFPIRIVGVLDEIGILQSHMTLIQNEGIILPSTYMRKNFCPKRRMGLVFPFLVQVKADVEVKEAMRQIKKKFVLLRNTSCGFVTLEEIIEYKNKFLKRVVSIGLCIAMIFLIVGGIGIMNIMLKSVIERTKEIGIRKAVGAKNRDILIQFLLEVFIIGILGCIVGIVIGFAICIVGMHFIPEQVVKPGNIVISLEAIFVSCGVALGISLLSGLYPAYKASSLPPIDALRYE